METETSDTYRYIAAHKTLMEKKDSVRAIAIIKHMTVNEGSEKQPQFLTIDC